MSTPYPQEAGEDRSNSSKMAQPPTPVTPALIPDADGHVHRPPPEVRQGYRPAALIQRFNNKSLNWPAWFCHFRAVADVHGWNKDQRALKRVSYLDETAMNVAQELGDNDLYNYDVLVKLLSDRFDPASRVSAFRSRFHGRVVSGGIPTESTGTAPGADCGTVRQRSIGPRVEKVPLGGHPDSEGHETPDSDRGMH